jgi:hypothetical protein
MTKIMDDRIRKIVEQIPYKPLRSKLEPHRNLIHELRKKRHSYRDIAAFLTQHLNMKVTHTTVRDFVHVRAKQPIRNQFEPPLPDARSASHSAADTTRPPSAAQPIPKPANHALSQPIYNTNPNPSVPAFSGGPPERKSFHFDPEKGCTLPEEILNLKPKKD